jgi:hypothetical protein
MVPEVVHPRRNRVPEVRVRLGGQLAIFETVGEAKRVVQVARLPKTSGTFGAGDARLRIGRATTPTSSAS